MPHMLASTLSSSLLLLLLLCCPAALTLPSACSPRCVLLCAPATRRRPSTVPPSWSLCCQVRVCRQAGWHARQDTKPLLSRTASTFQPTRWSRCIVTKAGLTLSPCSPELIEPHNWKSLLSPAFPCCAVVACVLQTASCTSCGSRSWQPCRPASSTCARRCTLSSRR